MNILVISGNYPSFSAPHVGTFVYKLVQKFVHLGCVVTVISPTKVSLKRKAQSSYGVEGAQVLRPKRISFSNKKFGFIDTFPLTRFFFARAIQRAIIKLKTEPDVVYCHFIVSALVYFQAHPRSKFPVYVAVGEYNNIDIIQRLYDPEYYVNSLQRVTGFVAVSPQIKAKLISKGVSEDKIIVEPNGVDRAVFKPYNKRDCRVKFGLPLDKKIVIFVGRFLHDKGPLRVLDAINQLSDDVVGVFIGRGSQMVEGSRVVYRGPLLHHDIPKMMAAADVFVLPTLHEGSSNVIVEAMACGLPIVSSKLPEVEVQCDPSFSILVNPLEIGEIAGAIQNITSDLSVQIKYSAAARAYSERFDLGKRAKRILDFMKNPVSS